MSRRRFTVARLPADTPPDVRQAIQTEIWNALRRSPVFWFLLLTFIMTAAGAEFAAVTAASRFGDILSLAVFGIWLLLLPLWNLVHNLALDHVRKAIWLAHFICPDCGYNLTGNTSSICPECAARIPPITGANV